jgi:glycine/D-amino acid oxidase-like deaminating enzyme
MIKERDYIIVGQGIAGTVLAFTLVRDGCSVQLLDDPALSSASKVAAGLYNPVVFKRLTKSWMADELIPFLDTFYTDLEETLSCTFHFKKEIIKLFAEEQEKEFWLKKTNAEVGTYLSKTIRESFLPQLLNSPMGAASVLHAGSINTRIFLEASANYFRGLGCLENEKLETDQLVISEDHITYKNYKAKKLIFCEGARAAENPYFKWLPFRLTKGEILTIRLRDGDEIPFDQVINKGVFILPMGNNSYRVGATHTWDDLNDEPTAEGLSELKEKLEKIIRVPFEITGHLAGVRPAVNDRRPMLGLHPEHPALAVFNGMGTKGVMLAPYFAKHFVDFLEHGQALDAEVDIQRFTK